jgi:DNA-binding NtrC family response regulator
MERAVLLCVGDVVTLEHLPEPRMDGRARTDAGEAEHVAAVDDDAQGERRRIVEALARCHGNQTRAARALGIARSTLVKRLDAFELPRPRKH